MKDLSIIIVNYNVVHFLEQCLISVKAALENIDAEVIVIDNNSVDGSVSMLREKFPETTLIANKKNVGFSKANNQGIKISKGRYVLLLNPDTVVEPDTFKKCIDFLDSHPDGGALGVYMVNGSGEFLPESKRSLPTPSVAFYKIFGLSALFPKSKTFGKYHLGYLDNNKTHKVEVLSGAYMMLRREALDKTGLLDEDFFMYGEDIDLSYRITKAGYENYYFPEARIIHYKGESTKKGSINYVFVFYQAMVIFARKHFSNKNARIFSFLINAAIYFRASVAIIRRTFIRLLYPLADAIIIFLGFLFLKQYWAENVKFGAGSDYPPEFTTVVVPVYIAIWLVSMFFSGAYDKPISISKAIRGLSIGTIIILVGYALLPESLRYSRALILLGFLFASIALSFYRYLLGFTKFKSFSRHKNKIQRIAIVGNREESERVASIIRKTDPATGLIGIISLKAQNHFSGYLGHVEQLREILKIYQIGEVVFCMKDMSAKKIIDIMTDDIQGMVKYRIAPPESLFLVGSGAIHTTSDLYMMQINPVNSVANKRNKRFFDITVALLFVLTSPVLIWLQKRPKGYFYNCFKVLIGKYSWVGYQNTALNPDGDTLPTLKHGVFRPSDGIKTTITNDEMIYRLNLLYAHDYKIATDIEIVLKNVNNIGTDHAQ